MKIKTVTIDRGGQPVVINKSDLSDSDVLWGERKASKPPDPVHDELPESYDEPELPDDKDDLISILAEHGIEKDKRSSVETLQELVRDL